ncbi:MAG: FAD:protein FMN transferase [Candidatus Omnitrophica bacterium]|nr:FAD:protein FMN transferase [Candidatus Omnitrophota bacterium]
MRKLHCIFFGLISCVFMYGCSQEAPQVYKETRVMMGTYVDVASPSPEAIPIAFGEIKRIDNLLSSYQPSSEVSILNRTGSLKVSPDMMFVINKSKEFWEVTDGAFDPTVGMLVDLWGFRTGSFRFPQDEEIKKILTYVGMNKVIINESEQTISFSVPGMRIELAAIAKGYAVDCAVRKLKKLGIKDCLINAGGEVYCLGTKLGKKWKVAIQNPHSKGFSDYIDLRNKAVATSGNYEQFFYKNNKRYSHIFNPSTGYPAEPSFSSVTVVAPDCMTADALATSIFVLGREKGEALAKKFSGVIIKIIE